MDSAYLIPIVAGVAFLLAGLVKGVIGMGLPTVVVGLVSLVSTPAHAAALLMMPSLATNLWQAGTGPYLPRLLRRLGPMLVGTCFGIWYGTGWLRPDGSGWAITALGSLLVAYAIVCLAKVQFSVPPRMERWLGPLIGVITGLVTASTGIFVLPGVPYIQALKMERDELVQGLGLCFAVSTIALTTSLASTGVLTASIAGASLAGIVPAIGGMVIGQRIRRKISAESFRRWFFIALIVLGASLAVRPLFR